MALDFSQKRVVRVHFSSPISLRNFLIHKVSILIDVSAMYSYFVKDNVLVAYFLEL